MMKRVLACLAIGGSAAIGSTLLAELLHHHAARAVAGTTGLHRAASAASAVPVAVITLGYPALRSGRISPLQAWRSEIAVRSLNSHPDSVLIFTGLDPRHGISEAQQMAAHAVARLGADPDKIRLEEQSRTTWDNVRYAGEMASAHAAIAFASDPMHALRATRYLLAQYPELAPRLVSGKTYRFLERPWLKVGTAVYEAVTILRRSLSAARFWNIRS